MNDKQAERDLAFANLMEKACRAYQVKRLNKATFDLYHKALSRFPIEQVEAQLDQHIETSEFFPKVVDLRPADGEEQRDVDIYNYGAPHHKTKNPKGNPAGIVLPESTRVRRVGELIADYERRIAHEVTVRIHRR